MVTPISRTTLPDSATDDGRGGCSTTDSFADHGIESGDVLIRSAYRRLATADAAAFEPTESFFETLASAFIWAYLGEVDEPGVPQHVEAAVDDARVLTFEEFRDDPDADLRTEVVPAFYRRVAGFHCAYRT